MESHSKPNNILGAFVVCFNPNTKTVGNPEAFAEFKRMNGCTNYVPCTSRDGIVSGTCYCPPLYTRVCIGSISCQLEKCVVAVLFVVSRDFRWLRCTLRW